MNVSTPSFVLRLIAAVGVLLTSTVLNAQGGGGAIEGRIFNAATGAALANARVVIEGTTREALTDESGGYRITGLPAGGTRLSISYLGFERQSATVEVPASGVVQRDVEMSPAGAARAAGETVKLQEFTVVADREMSAQAIAMNEQRYAPNIKNVVAIDVRRPRRREHR